jgi:hypothetical protein
MKKAFIFAVIGTAIFAVCYSLVYRVGAQFIAIVPSTESVIDVGVPIISSLMSVVALLQIHDLFRRKRVRR